MSGVLLIGSKQDLESLLALEKLLNTHDIDTRRLSRQLDAETAAKRIEWGIRTCDCLAVLATEALQQDAPALQTLQANTEKPVYWLMPEPVALQQEWLPHLQADKKVTVEQLIEVYPGRKNASLFGATAAVITEDCIYFGETREDIPWGWGWIGDTLRRMDEGYFVNGKHCGKGTRIWPEYWKEEGDFADDHLHGRGRLTVRTSHWDSVIYEGIFENGIFKGPGRCTWYGERNFFVGSFSEEKKCLNGKEYDAQGNLLAVYTDGIRTVASDEVYRGILTAGDPNGMGTLDWPDGAHYEGQLADGIPQGMGKWVTAGGDEYEGEFREGKPHGFGRGKRAGYVYEGQVKDGWRDGQGRQIDPLGGIYEGDFRKGERTGRGAFTWKNGTVYRGEFRNDYCVGTGKVTWADGRTYEGDISSNAPHGEGCLTWPNGDSYEGDVVQGYPDGKGTYTTAAGIVCVCYDKIKNGKVRGEVLVTWPDGKKVRGRLQDGKLENAKRLDNNPDLVAGDANGEGTLTWPKGDRYEGQLRDGIPNGTGKLWKRKCVFEGKFENGLCVCGKLTKSNGDTYEGTFLEELPEGTGIYTWANGRTYTGAFSKGEITGDGEFRWADGRSYRGTVRYGLPSGEGIMLYPNGNRYEGAVQYGDPHGSGILTYPNGDRYEGQFQYRRLHGEGRYIWANGAVYSGTFSESEFDTGEVRDPQGNVVATYVNGQLQ